MSEKSLDQLITALKSEAIEAAEKEAGIILDKAKEQAEEIVRGAEKNRDELLAEARKEAQAIRNNGEASLRQAGRDFTIAVRNELLQVFHALFESEIKKEFTRDLMKNAILNVIDGIGGDVEISLSPENAKDLADYIHHHVRSSGKTASILKDHTVLHGFTITKKDEGWSYTISPEEVAEGLKKYLNKHWIDILQKESES